MRSAFGRELLDEFDERLESLVDEAAQAIAEAINNAIDLAISKESRSSGGLPLLALEAAEPIIDEMREHMLAAYDVRQKIHFPFSDLLKDHLCEHAGKIYDRMPSLVLPPFIRMSLMARGLIQDEVDRRRERHEQLISQRLGGFKVSRQDPTRVVNAFTSNPSSTLGLHHADGFNHHNGLGNDRHPAIDIDWHSVRAAANELREILARPEMGEAVRDAWGPDLDTIAAQLRKPTPNEVVVREAGRSLRNLVEGALGDADSAPHVAALVSKLTSAVGLG